ncbi:MAG: AMP-binding protein [Ahrensia sp.]
MHIDATQPNYDALYASFRWTIPAQFNIGVACADEPASRTPDAPAIVDVEGAHTRVWTFSQLARLSNQVANALTALDIKRGDRVAIIAGQSIETAATHLGVYKAGAVAVPMAVQFGSDAIAYRLRKSGARAMLCDAHIVPRLAAIDLTTTELNHLIITRGAATPLSGVMSHHFDALTAKAKDAFTPVATSKDDPAMILFTSGTTGQPKAAVHAHRVLAGHLPGIQISQAMMPKSGDRLWTPSDWAWAGGLLNALLPALYFGVPVIAARAPKFEPDWAYDLIGAQGIANLFMPATALRLMLDAQRTMPAPLRAIGSAGEALGAATLEAAKKHWNINIDEFYGQTECNTVIGSSAALGLSRPGAMGKPTPGHMVAILDEDGAPLPRGSTGQIAVAKPDPTLFLHYLDDEPASAEKFHNGWLLTGDHAYVDEDGFFHFIGRNDDIITSSGYRIGPTEIEDVLTAHAAVKMAAIVGQPDKMRTERVVAYVVLHDQGLASDALANQLRQHVRERLSAHQYPREVHFVETIPLTESGKIIRRHFRNLAAD